MPDQLHGAIVVWLMRHCMQRRPELALYPEQELRLDVVYSRPEKGKCAQRLSGPVGATVHLPAPVGLTLPSGKLKDYLP